MHEGPPVSTSTWLCMLANELESQGFPPGYGPHLRHVATILDSTEPQIFKLENENIQLHEKLANKEQEFIDLRKDASVLWAKYQKAVNVVAQHDKQTAIAMAEYKPRFHDIL